MKTKSITVRDEIREKLSRKHRRESPQESFASFIARNAFTSQEEKLNLRKFASKINKVPQSFLDSEGRINVDKLHGMIKEYKG